MDQNNNPYGQQPYIPTPQDYPYGANQAEPYGQGAAQGDPYQQYQQAGQGQSVPPYQQGYQQNDPSSYGQGDPYQQYQQAGQGQIAPPYQQDLQQGYGASQQTYGETQQSYQHSVSFELPEQSPYQQQYGGRQKKKLNPLVIIIPAAAAVVIALVIILIVVLGGGSEPDNAGGGGGGSEISTSTTENSDVTEKTEDEKTDAEEKDPEPVRTRDVREYNNDNPYNISVLDADGNDVSEYVTVKRGSTEKIAAQIADSDPNNTGYNGSTDFLVGEPFMIEYEGARNLEIVFDLPTSLVNASSGGLQRFYVYYIDEKDTLIDNSDRADLTEEYSNTSFGVKWKSGVYMVILDGELYQQAFEKEQSGGSDEYTTQSISNSELDAYNSRNPFNLYISMTAAGNASELITIKSYGNAATFTVLQMLMEESNESVDPDVNFVVGESVSVAYPEDKYNSMAMGFFLPSSMMKSPSYYNYDYGDNRYSVFYMNDDDRWDVAEFYHSDSSLLFMAEPGTIYFLVDNDALFYSMGVNPADYNF